MKTRLLVFCAGAMIAAGGFGSVFAAQPDEKPAAAATPVAAQPPALRDADRTTAALNAAVTKRNDEVRARNDKAKADFEAEQAAYKAAQAAYEAQVRATKAAAAKAQREHAKNMAEWEAQVAACKAGDYARCGAGAAGSK